MDVYSLIGSPNYDKKTPLYILSADGRFPDSVSPGFQLEEGDHFLAMFPCYKTSSMPKNIDRHDNEKKSDKHFTYPPYNDNGAAQGWFPSFLKPIEKWIQDTIFPTRSVAKHTFFRGQKREEIGELVGGGRSIHVMESVYDHLATPDFSGWPSLHRIVDADDDYHLGEKAAKKRKKKAKSFLKGVFTSPSTVDENRVDDKNDDGDDNEKDLCKNNRWLGDVNKILKHGASCKSLTTT